MEPYDVFQVWNWFEELSLTIDIHAAQDLPFPAVYSGKSNLYVNKFLHDGKR
jgi:hypothetical protein